MSFRQRLETAKTRSTNQNAYVRQNYGDHKRNQSKNQNEMCKIDDEEWYLYIYYYFF